MSREKMTIDEAIAIIRKEYLCVDRDCDIERNCGKCDLMMPSKEPILEAYKMAIKALEQEPCGDAISRQAVINLIRGCNNLKEPPIFDSHNSGVIFEHYITKLSSVNPQEPKTGHWIDREVYDADRWKCSECGRTEPYKEKYCHCGAKMVEPQESENKG
jgi:hypothetical protein